MPTPDQISFYDESLKKEVEGSYRYDGKAIHVNSVKYGYKSALRGGCLDRNEVYMLAQKTLSELAREKDSVTSPSHKKAT